ncbi:hypothetical protein PSEG_01492 [Pseudomonas sp. Nvir]|nr:hypothetical protein PSNVIR_02244 [Pseudomonas sp. Nvir]SUD77364.1 Uncharacterised protein [Pseudomonas putida]
MNTLSFSIMIIGSVVIAFTLRHLCSGRHLGYSLLFICFAYNVFFITYYMRAIEQSYFLFVGYQPLLLTSNPALGWMTLFGIFLHCGAMPSKRVPGRKCR